MSRLSRILISPLLLSPRRCLGYAMLPILLGGAAQMHAQSLSATIRGVVTDPAGNAVTGATVTLREPATGQLIGTAQSRQAGEFEFDELKPGTYQLRCASTGFTTYVAQNIILNSGDIRRMNVALALGETTQEVTVSAGASVISTESPTIQGTFTARQFEESPQVTIYTSVYNLLTTIPGIQGGVGGFPVIDGEQQSQQSQTFDGIPNDLDGQQSNNTTFFDEVSASAFNAPADSPVPAVINDVTKRGTNTFHGRASYRIYDSVLDAAGYFDPTKTPYLQHEWDLEGGGPIWKDHTFFYAGWFAQRIPLGTQFQANVPTLDWRQGIFATTITDPQTGQPFANNTIPTTRMSAVALAVQNKYLPAPNVNTSQPVNNYNFFFPFNSDLYRGDWPIWRIDHNLTKSNSLYVRWLMRQTPYVLNNGLPALVWTRFRRHQQWAAGDTQIVNTSLVNNFRLGYSIDRVVDGQPEAGQTPPNGAAVLQAIGLEGANPGNTTGQGFPEMDISGITSLSDVPGGVKEDNTILTLSDSVVYQYRQHSFRFGGELLHINEGEGEIPNYGTFTFDGSITGQAYADFLLGLPIQSQRTAPLGTQHQTLSQYALYGEDSWQATRRLTVTYGVRWDLYGTPKSSDQLMYNWDPATGDILVDPAAIARVSPLYPANITVVPGLVQAKSDKLDIVPRIGVAYMLTANSVVRGGYGIYTSRFDNGTGYYNPFMPINPQLGSTGPFSISEIYLNGINPNGTAQLAFPNPYPATTATAQVPSQSVYGYPRQIHQGDIQQYSLTYETELEKFGLRASYLGSRSSGLDYEVNTNLPMPSLIPFTASRRPEPQFYSTYLLNFNGGTHFDALQFAAKRRVSGLTFDASYSFNRSLANYLDTENPYDVLSHWANDSVTRKHYAVASVVWALPFGQGQRYLGSATGWEQRAAGGWSTSVITYLASGLYFSPSYDTADPSNTGTFGGLPDRVGDPNDVPGGKNINQWFNDAAFAVPAAGTFGNARPNSIESQNLIQTQISLTKSVQLYRRLNFQFVSQISNLFNHPQFLSPSGDISVAGGNQFTSQFGTFDSLEAGQQRQITFQGVFTF